MIQNFKVHLLVFGCRRAVLMFDSHNVEVTIHHWARSRL